MKIGFIGAGNMATAIIKGVINSKLLNCNEINAFDICSDKVNELAEELKINICGSVDDLINISDAIVLAVKPNVFPSLLNDIKQLLKNKNSLIISIAAGKTIEFISQQLGYNAKIIRIMPNINATVGEAMSAYCCNELVSSKEICFAESFCASFGKAISLPESQFPIFGVIAGCAPAFSYMFIDSLARAAVKNGMAKSTALEIATQTVLGSAKQIAQSNLHPWELVDRVCSPGGTTIEGVNALQADSFEATIQKAVDASFEKDKKL